MSKKKKKKKRMTKKERKGRAPKKAKKAEATPTGFLVTGPIAAFGDVELGCPCPICNVLREELGEVPEIVKLEDLSPEARERLKDLRPAA